MKYCNMYPRGVSLLLLLLCTLGVSAQQLQFWFDSDKTIKQADTSAGTVKGKIDVQELSQGFHTIYMRVKQPGAEYEYSPITMSTFIKFATGEDSQLQYWFDEDVDNLSTIAVDVESGKEQTLTLDLSNIERFPLGVHQLNMRVAHNGGHYSPIYSAYVLRLPGGTGDSMLEYWFDDNYENHASMPVSTDKDGIQKLDLDLSDMSKFPYGLHRLNMRVASLGSQFSPIYSATVMRLRGGPNNYLTYWLDDDYANRRHTWSTTGNGKDAYFKVRLDFASASAGMHRLHYRIASQNQDDGPVYEFPILITRLYNNMLSDVTITNQSTWLDDADAKQSVVAKPSSVFTKIFQLEPSSYAEDQQHAFHMQFQNSAGVWSAQNVTYFYKDASGKLRAGRVTPEDDVTAINETSESERYVCYYREGSVIVDCQSSKLAKAGLVVVCDLTGRVVAREEVDCGNGLHAELNVNNFGRQMLIVKVLSGGVHYSKKLLLK